VVCISSLKTNVQTINAEDIMSIPTSLTRGKNVFAKNVELAFVA